MTGNKLVGGAPGEGVHTKPGSSQVKRVNSSFFNCTTAEDKKKKKQQQQQQQARENVMTGGGRSWGGDDSPVSVIHANFNMQLSHPSSACTSMEHPLSPPPAAPVLKRSSPHHVIPRPAAQYAGPRDLQEEEEEEEEAQDSCNYAGLLSERVQQAFSKSHQLNKFMVSSELNRNPRVEVKPPWPNYAYKKELEWLNLQQDPSSNGVSKTTWVQSHNLGGSPEIHEGDDDGEASEEGFSIYTSNSTSRDQDEDSVIDFFPAPANRPGSALQLRRQSYDRINEAGRINGRINDNQKRVTISLSSNRRGINMHASSAHDDGREMEEEDDDDDDDDDEGVAAGCTRGRLSSSKWDDAARWLTSPAAAAASCRGRRSHSNDHLHFLLQKASRQQLVQAPPPAAAAAAAAAANSKLSDSPAPAQDKHVPENIHEPKGAAGNMCAGSHAAAGTMRDAGTEVQLEKKRDIGTQSTPAEWSRCDSPNAEGPNYSTTVAERGSAANYSTGAEKGTASQKTSPPRHNTPARRSVSCSKQSYICKQGRGCAPANYSGKLNLLELESCHLDKLKLARDLPLGTSSTWQLVPEDDTEGTQICDKLMECKTNSMYGNGSFHQHHAKVNMLEARVSAWEDVERAKHFAKFKREEAKIEAWESLQRAEADAELRKLEVKLEKMRFEGREKIMGKLGAAQRRAQEMRGAAEAQKAEQVTRVGMRATHIRKSGHLPSSTFNVVCKLNHQNQAHFKSLF